jgi:hypothetical protein
MVTSERWKSPDSRGVLGERLVKEAISTAGRPSKPEGHFYLEQAVFSDV